MTLILGFLLANFFHMSHTFNLHGKAWRGGVRHGSARPGEAWRGLARGFLTLTSVALTV